MLENIRLSLQGILSHKVRSILTMLGIIIGIAAIIAIVSTIKGTNEQIKNNLIGAGNNTVSVQLYQGDSPYDFTYQSAPDGVPVISQAVRDNIAALDNVESASFYRTRSYCNNVYYQNTQFSGAMFGIDARYFDTAGYEVQQGIHRQRQGSDPGQHRRQEPVFLRRSGGNGHRHQRRAVYGGGGCH